MFDKVITIIACIIIFLFTSVIISLFYINEQSLNELECLKTNQCEEVR